MKPHLVKPKEPDPILRRGGIFRVATDLVRQHPQEVIKLLEGVLVVRCELQFECDALVYSGISDQFATCEPEVAWPEYEVLFSIDG